MPNAADRNNQHVLGHLAAWNIPPSTLDIATELSKSWVITTVRNRDRSTTWTEQFADHLHAALAALERDAYIRRSNIRDRMVVVWDGV